MFTTEHFIWIGICIVFIAGLTVLSLKCRFSFRTAATVMALIALASEASKILSHMQFVNGADAADGMVIEATALPLHLCSLLIFAIFYLPFSKEGRLKQYILSLMTPIALIGGTLAILLATSGTDFTTSFAYQCFLYHAGLIWFVLYLLLAKQVELGRRAWLTNLVSLLGLVILMVWVNGALQAHDTNFFYVVRPPLEGLPLLNLDHGWYAYFGVLLACGLIGLTAVHLPFMLKEARGNKK